MNSTHDCILGVLAGPTYVLKYPGIEAYLVSIEKSGFSGRKIMLVWNIHPITRKYLLQYGFEVIDVPNPIPQESFFHTRIRIVADYLPKHYQEFRYIFWLDIKDLILQSNPSVWMEENIGSYKLVGSTECVTIEQEETNQLWARTILGNSKYEEIKNEEVINGGTWAGESEMMMNVFQQVYAITKEYDGSFPPCQPSINYVLRQEPFKSSLYIPRWDKSFAACLHPFWSWSARAKCRPFVRDNPPVLNYDTGILYPSNGHNPKNNMIAFNRYNKTIIPGTNGPLFGCECVTNSNLKPFAIVHGYDRDWQIREVMESKYEMDKSNKNLVSIFTPTHNPSYLLEVYKSLQEQTDPDWEWVVVHNNGSKPVGFAKMGWSFKSRCLCKSNRRYFIGIRS